MTTRKLLTLTVAAAFLSAPFAMTASAATNSTSRHATASTRHHVAKPARATSRATARRAPTSSDNSADQLNAQSLARARGATQ
ncbi:MAG TPA: hypothetical protein VE650_04735 [Acetobacteraceae bacterium]|jgi:Ni/Co efflux regulator RcnB|nr:hypothetical protein [Acetobacteraceae bacterium]